MIAKTVCGFANAEGGLLVVGIETVRADGIDVASNVVPIRDLSRVRNLVTAAIPELLSPQHNAVSVHSVTSSTELDEGYLLVEVPPSDNRPHMSISEQRYFRRGSDGTRVLVHSEVRELMFAVREGALDLKCGLRSGASSGDLRFQLWLVLNICNVGRVPVIAPFVRINDPGWMTTTSLEPFSLRNTSKGRFGIYGTRDLVVHVEDEIGMAEIGTGLDFRGTGQGDLRSAVSLVKSGNLSHAFSMGPWAHSLQSLSQRDFSISVSGSFGAENAPARQFELHIGKNELLELFIQHLSLE